MRVFDRDVYEVNITELELDECHRIIATRPIEGLILKCADERRFDLGALCYQERKRAARALIKKVEFNSLRPERTKALRAWIVYEITLFYTSKSSYTIYQHATALNGLFNWADISGHEDFLETPENYHQALQSYTQELNRQLDKQKCHYTANRLQSAALNSGHIFFPNASINFRDDLPIISVKSKTRNPTQPPSQQEIEEYLTPCQYIFDGLSDFLLNFENFPAKIQFMQEHIWLIPGEYPYISEEVYNRTPKARNNICWNYRDGLPRTLQEAIKFSCQPEHRTKKLLNNAHIAQQEANSDMRHEMRMRLAKIAHDTFVALFVANTGMNEQPLRDLPFDPNYETFDSGEIGFQGIKLRASGRQVSFSIRKAFIKHFDKFIRLRRYICDDDDQEFLFVGMTIHGQSIGGQLRIAEVQSNNLRISHHLIPEFNGLSYRKLRKYKSNYLLSKGHKLQVVSTLMQTSESTILKSYAEANENTAITEITAMLNRLVALLEDYSGEEIPVGDCVDTNGRAEAVPPPPDYEPNCKNFEGCIFCSQFRTHANEPSIRKLLSMRYVTLEYLSSCEDKNHFDKVHGAAVVQIDRIIAELIAERPEMENVVDRVRAQISNNFELSDYWKRFYHRMLKLRIMK